jgi:hypothetical protein
LLSHLSEIFEGAAYRLADYILCGFAVASIPIAAHRLCKPIERGKARRKQREKFALMRVASIVPSLSSVIR